MILKIEKEEQNYDIIASVFRVPLVIFRAEFQSQSPVNTFLA